MTPEQLQKFGYTLCLTGCGRHTNNSSGKCVECRKVKCKCCGKIFAKKVNISSEFCSVCRDKQKIKTYYLEAYS